MTDDAHFSSLTDVGRVRDHNEDTTAVIDPPDADDLATKGVLGVVADGMGGHEAGEVASSRAVDAFVRAYYAKEEPDPVRALAIAVKAANDAVRTIQAVRAGTTLVAAAIVGDEAHLINVGDSRAYLVTPDAIRQITRDHSWVQDQVAGGHLTPEQARVHPRRNVLTRCLGGDSYVHGDYYHETMYEGCSIVLCSDGLHGMVSDKEIGDVVRRADPDRAALDLISLANKHGGHDNISVVILRKGGIEGLQTGFKTVRADAPRSKALAWILGGAIMLAAAFGGVIWSSGLGKGTTTVVAAATTGSVDTTTVTSPGGSTDKTPKGAVVPPKNGAIPQAIMASGQNTIVLSVDSPKAGPKVTLSNLQGEVLHTPPIAGTEIRDIQPVADKDNSVWVLTDAGLYRVTSIGKKVNVASLPMGQAPKADLRSVGAVKPDNAYPVAAKASGGLWRSFGAGKSLDNGEGGVWLLPSNLVNGTSVKWTRDASPAAPATLVVLGNDHALYSFQVSAVLTPSVQRMTKDTENALLQANVATGARLAAQGDQRAVAVWSENGDRVQFYRPIGGRLAPLPTKPVPDRIVWLSGTPSGYVALTKRGASFHLVNVPTPSF